MWNLQKEISEGRDTDKFKDSVQKWWAQKYACFKKRPRIPSEPFKKSNWFKMHTSASLIMH